ncbi:UDP-N-acetylmuramoyl-tripeptide--D-alanyl-D-alanine ligase [Streptomyces sp. CBMA156]|uniref:UDP-N-acetylmuramoyl-tripeptide--D-alanyl-D- alanine ligase n=1 Tax=Streptomyces sp. CBMA156 TaxID=1930280 RepID=UPI001661F817|nr:UDP-N-acetylmuramoyl-tripeptide--D-alanyl-D-alanine ligase [Streptomyces sp. CBMA156]MBD0673116.1 hypothetical protein [Streptomyces sp. CBMA156]
MIRLTIADIAGITGGALHDVPDPSARLTAFGTCYVSAVRPGGLYVAVPGSSRNGHARAGEAIAAGAVCVLATRPVGVPAVVVPDVARALELLARHVLARTRPTVVAVTGSVGKTTTKDLLAQVLARHDTTRATWGNLNSPTGLCLSVLSTDETTRHLVLEIGAHGPGSVGRLASLVSPRVGIVLNVGSAHLGTFGTREALAETKSELVRALGPDGVAVLNADDPRVAAMARRTPGRTLTFGTRRPADVHATGITLRAARAGFTLHTPGGSAPVALRLLGAHQVHNALAAAAAAHALGMGTGDIAAALSAAEPTASGRLRILQRPDGVTIVDDAYNASAESVRAGIDALVAYAAGRRTVAVLGRMLDLGEWSAAAHTDVGRHVGAAGVQVLVPVGEGDDITALTDAARNGPTPPRIEPVPDPDALLALLDTLLVAGDVVLLKASHEVGLSRAAHLLHTRATR